MNNAEPNEIVTRHLFALLAQTVEKLRREQTLTDAEIAKAYLSVALGVLIQSCGPALAAEHLRDVADATERDLCGLPGLPR